MEKSIDVHSYGRALFKSPELYQPFNFPPSPNLSKDTMSDPFNSISFSNLPIQHLPRDIIFFILSSLDSLNTFSQVIRTSRLLYSMYQKNPLSICLPIARRQFPPAAFELLDLWRPGGMSPLAREHMAIYAELGAEDSSLSPNKSHIGLPELKRLQADYNYIRNLVLSNRQKGRRTPSPASSPAVEREINDFYQLLTLAKYFHPPPGFIAKDQLNRPTGGRTPVPFDFSALLSMPLSNLQRITFTASKYRFYWPWARRLIWPQAQGPNLEETFMTLCNIAGRGLVKQFKEMKVWSGWESEMTIWEKSDEEVREKGVGELVDCRPDRKEELCERGELIEREVETVGLDGEVVMVWCLTLIEEDGADYNPYGFH